LFWKRSTNQGALFSIFCSLVTWLPLSIFGSLTPQWIRHQAIEEDARYLMHLRAAMETQHVAVHPHTR